MTETRFKFGLVWQEKGPSGLLSTYGREEWFDTLAAAREAHFQARKGLWVKRGMHRPHVTALRVVKSGRILQDELAEKKDLPDFGNLEAAT